MMSSFYFYLTGGHELIPACMGEGWQSITRLAQINTITVTFSPLRKQDSHAARQQSQSLTRRDAPNCLKCSLINTCVCSSSHIGFSPPLVQKAHRPLLSHILKCACCECSSWQTHAACVALMAAIQ